MNVSGHKHHCEYASSGVPISSYFVLQKLLYQELKILAWPLGICSIRTIDIVGRRRYVSLPPVRNAPPPSGFHRFESGPEIH
jgi:hypothetical protein